MKKLLCIGIASLMAISMVQAEENTSEPGIVGVGYEGMFMGDVLMNGLAVRGRPAPVGWAVELAQGNVDDDYEGSIDLFALKGKVFYGIIQRENSAFYAGASLGYWMMEVHLRDEWKREDDGWSIAPLMGVEWNFQGLPELGFNFEVSYEFNSLSYDRDEPGAIASAKSGDLTLNGIAVNTGVVYYF